MCPSCSGVAEETQGRFGPRHACCGLWSWNGKPLVDKDTHAARIAAHEAFDVLWKVHGLRRSHSYRLLRQELGLTEDECHMANMDADTARRVPAAVDKIRASL